MNISYIYLNIPEIWEESQKLECILKYLKARLNFKTFKMRIFNLKVWYSSFLGANYKYENAYMYVYNNENQRVTSA